MKRIAFMLTAAAAALAAGCQQPGPGSTLVLGDVPFSTAFAAAQDVLARNDFPIESADPTTGVIRTRPRPVEEPGQRLLSETPTRRFATLRLRRQNALVAAELAVAQQRQDTEVFRQMVGPAESYDGVPNITPAQLEGPTTPQQRHNWRTETYRRDIERQILNELYLALHPGEND